MPLFGGLFGRTAARRTAVPPGLRVYAVGDVHGRADLLSRALELIRADWDQKSAAEMMTVFVGDYVDRGPSTPLVLDTLCGLSSRLITLRGNHEQMLLDFLEDPEAGSVWLRNGGLETLHSYGVDVRELRSGRGAQVAALALKAAIPASHIAFLTSTRLSHVAGDYFFCHAGVNPRVSLEAQKPEDLLWIREGFLDSNAVLDKVVVHGHTPTEEPVVRSNRIGIDTGAYISGRLTCLVLEGEERRFLEARR